MPVMQTNQNIYDTIIPSYEGTVEPSHGGRRIGVILFKKRHTLIHAGTYYKNLYANSENDQGDPTGYDLQYEHNPEYNTIDNTTLLLQRDIILNCTFTARIRF